MFWAFLHSGNLSQCLEGQKYHPWVEMVFGTLESFSFMGVCNRFAFEVLLPFLIPTRLQRVVEGHYIAITKKIVLRMAALEGKTYGKLAQNSRHEHDEVTR